MGRTIYFNFLKSYRCQNHAKFTSNLTSHSIQPDYIQLLIDVVLEGHSGYAARGRHVLPASGP